MSHIGGITLRVTYAPGHCARVAVLEHGPSRRFAMLGIHFSPVCRLVLPFDSNSGSVTYAFWSLCSRLSEVLRLNLYVPVIEQIHSDV